MTARGSTLVEFALAWPIALTVVFACVQLAIWGAEQHAARSAALAGARAGSAADAGPATASEVALATLAPSLVGAGAQAWCPGSGLAPSGVWVCARDLPRAIEVSVGGSIPALFPLVGARGLPLAASADVGKERFQP
jgi:hypothetical protein